MIFEEERRWRRLHSAMKLRNIRVSHQVQLRSPLDIKWQPLMAEQLNSTQAPVSRPPGTCEMMLKQRPVLLSQCQWLHILRQSHMLNHPEP